MYTIRRFTTSVRAEASSYGDVPHSEEAYAGAGVLKDLSDAEAVEIPLILARYVALRAWTLRSERAAPAAVIAHALSAALEHLSAVPGEWLEGEILGEALRGGRGHRPLALLEAAAVAAEERGHHHGARTLREAVRRRPLGGDGSPSRSLS